jgi:hypothetical protein
MIFRRLALAIGLCASFSSTSFAKSLVPVEATQVSESGLSVMAHSEKVALKAAHVWIETADGKVLNEGLTDADGRYTAPIADAELSDGVNITAFATGYGAVSFLQNKSHRVALEVSPRLQEISSTIEGTVSGFQESEEDGKGMIGLVAKTFDFSDLVELDVNSFLSPLTDTIDIFGAREVPSNLVFPDQTFSFLFIPIHLNKPTFRLPILGGTASRYFGVTGLLPISDSINALRKKNFWEIINLLEFSKVGITPVMTASTHTSVTKRLDVMTNIGIQDSMHFYVGKNITQTAGSRRLAVAIWEPQPGMFIPTDLKNIEANEINLKAIDSRAAKVLDVLVSKDGNHYRGAWVDIKEGYILESGLNADLNAEKWDSTWMLHGVKGSEFIVAHVESLKKSKLGRPRFEDEWVIVAPAQASFTLPQAALHQIKGSLGTISHVSVDLLQTRSRSYPFIKGETLAGELSALEKVRKAVQ